MMFLQDDGRSLPKQQQDQRPVSQRFDEDLVLLERDPHTRAVLREHRDGHVWITAYASFEAMAASGPDDVEHVQVRGRTLRARIPATVGIRFRITRDALTEVTIRWPRSS
jgi:hypothetical protein